MGQKVALVTGGTGGIGTAICKELADMDYKVASNYRNEEKAQAWKKKRADEGYEFILVEGDVCDYEACGRMVAEIEEQAGPVDVLINNAGITRDTTFHKMDPSQWTDVINTDLSSVYNVTRHVIEGMRERRFGRVVNIASINGQRGQYGQANYAAAKAGMHGFSMALAQESAKHGITVNTVSPGYIATDMVMAVPERVREKIVAQIPMGRLGYPEDVAHVVGFLVSDKACFITGANLSVNGGHYMGW
ncbi:MAG: acetoacetyl-CoA reductase [Gammaproteobacteria bacterium]|nr:MAG: acetoacetyl-CoA reductase [Gammaproteobacteria bacterium]